MIETFSLKYQFSYMKFAIILFVLIGEQLPLETATFAKLQKDYTCNQFNWCIVNTKVVQKWIHIELFRAE